MEIGKIKELSQEKTPAEKLEQLVKAVATDPKDWCCATCAYLQHYLQYDGDGCVDECVNMVVTPILIMNNDDAKTFGCKFWEAKDD